MFNFQDFETFVIIRVLNFNDKVIKFIVTFFGVSFIPFRRDITVYKMVWTILTVTTIFKIKNNALLKTFNRGLNHYL